MIPNSNINVSHYFTEGEPDVKIYSVKFDVHNKYIAAGTSSFIQLVRMEL